MATCPCDALVFPPIPDIPAGLDRLPRQIGGFPEFRQALLARIALQPALDAWRAREGDDFGLMIIEWWAYVLDVLAFYSGEIANELYLRTARRDESLRRLTALIGYVPRPPLAASATLALFAEPGQPINVPIGTSFRSDAFDAEKPQIFETTAAATVASTLNTWTLAPIRPTTFGAGPLLIEPRTASLSEGQLVLLEYGATRTAARVSALASQRMLDGQTYVLPTLDPAPAIPPDQPIDQIRLTRPALRAGVNAFSSRPVNQHASSVTLILDALYGQARVGSAAILEDAASGQLHAALIITVALQSVSLDPDGGLVAVESSSLGSTASLALRASSSSSSSAAASMAPTAPFTAVTLDGPAPSWVTTADPGGLTLHFAPVPAGRVTQPGKLDLALADLLPSAALVGPVPPLQLPTASQVLLTDA